VDSNYGRGGEEVVSLGAWVPCAGGDRWCSNAAAVSDRPTLVVHPNSRSGGGRRTCWFGLGQKAKRADLLCCENKEKIGGLPESLGQMK
jgi:hypothetical protein